MSTSATIRATAMRLWAMGLNVNLLGGDKSPIHKWKSKPDYTTARQTERDFNHLPWRGYIRRDGTRVAPPVGNAIINGIGDVRTLDLDKCTDPAQLNSAKEYVEAIIVAARNAYNLETEMKAAGCTLVSTDKDGTRHYTSIRSEPHDMPLPTPSRTRPMARVASAATA